MHIIFKILGSRGEWGGGDHLRKFINIFIWNWFFLQISYRDVQYRIIT